jgi:hypothetical protein
MESMELMELQCEYMMVWGRTSVKLLMVTWPGNVYWPANKSVLEIPIISAP